LRGSQNSSTSCSCGTFDCRPKRGLKWGFRRTFNQVSNNLGTKGTVETLVNTFLERTASKGSLLGPTSPSEEASNYRSFKKSHVHHMPRDPQDQAHSLPQPPVPQHRLLSPWAPVDELAALSQTKARCARVREGIMHTWTIVYALWFLATHIWMQD